MVPEAAYYVLNKVHNNRLPVLLFACIANLMNAILLTPLAIISVHPHLSSISLIDWLVLLAVGLSSGLFYVFWSAGTKKIDAATSTLFTATMPLATVIIAWLALSEEISLIQVLGMLIIISSIFINSRGKTKYVSPQ